jgi:argininosuccinate synthase
MSPTFASHLKVMTDSPDSPPSPTASYEARPDEVRRVLLLYSGGLDTSVMLKWIQDRYEAEVVCLTVNLGQPGEDYEVIAEKARRLGALACHVVDAREQFARDYVVPAIKANALYGAYPLFTALGRPLIAKLAVDHAREHDIPIKTHPTQPGAEMAGSVGAPYSIDDNLWGRSSEGRWIEELDHAPEDDVFGLVTPPERAPDEAEIVEVEFERGVPVGLNGERVDLVELIERTATIAARHGVGIVDHIEDRIVGLKVRDIYEVPAAAVLLPAHQELEKLVCTIHQNQFKAGLDRQWAYLVYAGLWWEPLRGDLDAYMDSVNAQVTGTIGIKLYKGHARVVTRSSPNAVYDQALASFGESGGLFSQAASPGFIELWSLQSRMAWRLRNE